MAGIGFRLKRLIAEETYGGWLRAHLYGAVVSSGPWLLSVCTLAALAFLSRDVVPSRDHALFRSIAVYTYTATLVTTGGLQMIVTRHLADALYLGRVGVVMTSFRWSLAVTALVHLVIAAAFYALAPDLTLGVRLFGVALFVVVACTWVVMVFVGAAQDYASVGLAFLVGNAVSLAAALGLGAVTGLAGYVGGFVLGQAAVLFLLEARIEREFGVADRPETSGLAAAAVRYRLLALGGFLYNAAISVDRIVFWCSSEGVRVGTWFYGSLYDTPIFLAYLSVVPSLAIFLVSVETEFYDRYRRYYGVVTRHGTLGQVLEAKRAMSDALGESLRRLLMVQAPVTLTLMALAREVAAVMGLEPIQVGIFRVALVGAVLHILTLFGTIILLYFDHRRAAVEVSAVFFAGNLVLTVASLLLGPRFYGQGYLLAALAACAWTYVRVGQTFDDLEYLTFASQPMAPAAG